MENKKSLKNILEWINCIIIAIILALLFRYYIGTPTVVKKSSMYPTLQENQRLLLNRWLRTAKKLPNRGDIITFQKSNRKVFILRFRYKQRKLYKENNCITRRTCCD